MSRIKGMPASVAVAIVVIGLSVIIFGPLINIWSLNTLFGLGIDYNFWTWFAMLWLSTVTFGSYLTRVKRNKGE